MDLTDQPNIKHKWTITDGVLTIQFKDDSDTVLGDIIIEGNRFRSLQEALNEVSRKFFPDVDSGDFVGHKTLFKGDEANTEFEL